MHFINYLIKPVNTSLKNLKNKEAFMKMKQEQFVLSIFSVLKNYRLSPIQIQKLFFLLEKKHNDIFANCSNEFQFKPHYYGPYSKKLNDIVNKLTHDKYLATVQNNDIRYYQINTDIDNNNYSINNVNTIIELADYILNKGFKELCFAIYEDFPEMKENSIFFVRGN
jgi:uncharacterized protein YwgA